jgi:hypothetical protein
MNEKIKLLAGIIVFGSLWGFSETIIGPMINDSGLPTGMLMTGIFAMVFLTMSRLMFRQRGMQAGMGLVACSLRFLNPFGACHICSAIAIIAEGFIFEMIFNHLSTLDLREIKSQTTKIGLGIFSSYCIFVGGYIVTQILTPLSFGAFYLNNFLIALPSILAAGLPAALLGSVIFTATLQISKIDLKLTDRLYYPTTIGISVFCWITVILNYLLMS